MASFDSERFALFLEDFFNRQRKKGRAFMPEGNYCYRWVDDGEQILIRMWGKWDEVCGSIGYRRGQYPRTRKDWFGDDVNLR